VLAYVFHSKKDQACLQRFSLTSRGSWRVVPASANYPWEARTYLNIVTHNKGIANFWVKIYGIYCLREAHWREGALA